MYKVDGVGGSGRTLCWGEIRGAPRVSDGGPVALGAGSMCPVCRWPAQGGQGPCEKCQWDPGVTPPGERPTAAGKAVPDGRLADRQRDHDLLAAARVAGITGARDDALLARLARLARGTPPDATHINQAVRQADRVDRHPRREGAGLGFALIRLMARKTDTIAFVEIGRDAVSVQTLVIGERGALVRQVHDSMPWSSLLPLLPADADLRYLRMAGGVGMAPWSYTFAPGGSTARRPAGEEDTGPAGLLAAVDDAITPALRRLVSASSAAAVLGRGGRPPSDSGGWDTPGGSRSPSSPGRAAPHRVDSVLVHRTHGWPLLEEAVLQARAMLRPVAEITALDARPLAEVVAEVAKRVPVRYPYDLVLAEVNRRTGAVRPVRCELFPAGVSVPAGGPPLVQVVELAPVASHAAEAVLLPVIERRGPVPDARDLKVVAERWPLVAMESVTPAGKRFTLRAQLRGPGELALATVPAQPGGAGEPGANGRLAGWPALLAELPSRISPSSMALDLVVLVELGGRGGQQVAERVALARDLIDAFRHEPEASIAVLGYRDHFGRHRVDAIAGSNAREDEALIVGCGPSTPAGALAVLNRPVLWRPVPMNDDHAAPVECALRPLLADGPLPADKWGWRPGARHVLVIIGRRPPHPPEVDPDGEVMLPCPHHHSWKRSLAKLRGRHAVECLAVLDRSPVTLYATDAWGEIADLGTRRLGHDNATAQRLKQIVGSAPAHSAGLRLATLAGAASSPQPGKEAGS